MAGEEIRLKKLYAELDKLSSSGEDVVADLRKEINNLELAYLKETVFPEVYDLFAARIKDLRCDIDCSVQFSGEEGRVNYCFCTSGTMVMVQDSIDAKSCVNPIVPPVVNSGSQTDVVETNDYIVKSDLRIEDYSEKSFAVYGDSRSFANEFRKLGGYFNPRLRGGVGWVFSKRRKSDILELLSPFIANPITEDTSGDLFNQVSTKGKSELSKDIWISRILSMNCMAHKGISAPHKAVFMLAIIDSIKRGYIRGNRIFPTPALENCFIRLWRKHVPTEWPFSPKAFQPFIHMSNESYYFLQNQEGVDRFNINQSWNRSSVVRYVRYAYFDDQLFQLLHKRSFTDRLSKEIINKFFKQVPVTPAIEQQSAPSPSNLNAFAGYRCYLATLLSNKGRPYASSTINVYATSLRNMYMEAKVSKFAGIRDLEKVSELSVIDDIINDVKREVEDGIVNNTSYLALKLFREYRRLNPLSS